MNIIYGKKYQCTASDITPDDKIICNKALV